MATEGIEEKEKFSKISVPSVAKKIRIRNDERGTGRGFAVAAVGGGGGAG